MSEPNQWADKTDRQRLSDATAEIHGLQDRLAVVEANLRLREQELLLQAGIALAQRKTIDKLERQRRNQRRELRNLQKAHRAVLDLISYRLGGPGFGENLTGRLDDDLRARGATPAEGAASVRPTT